MKRAFLALCLLGLMATPVQADHSTHDYFDGNEEGHNWNPSGAEEVCVSTDFQDHLSPNETDHAFPAILEAVDRWEEQTQFPTNLFLLQAFCGDFNVPAEWAASGNFCDSVPLSRPSSIQMDDNVSGGFSVSADAATITCDRNENGVIDYFVIWFDKDWEDLERIHYRFEPGSYSAEGEIDFGGLLMHELGHAIGWDGEGDGHLGSPCGHDSSYNTMCSGSWGYYNGTTGTGMLSRDLESHDIGETNEVY